MQGLGLLLALCIHFYPRLQLCFRLRWALICEHRTYSLEVHRLDGELGQEAELHCNLSSSGYLCQRGTAFFSMGRYGDSVEKYIDTSRPVEDYNKHKPA